MSIMNRVQEILAANPGVSWNDLVRQQLVAAVAAPHGGLSELWDRWFAGQGYTTGSLNDKMKRYWDAQAVPLADRNYFTLAVKAFFTGAVLPDATVVGTPVTLSGTSVALAVSAPAGSQANDYVVVIARRDVSETLSITGTGTSRGLLDNSTVTGVANVSGIIQAFQRDATEPTTFTVSGATLTDVYATTFLVRNAINSGSTFAGQVAQRGDLTTPTFGALSATSISGGLIVAATINSSQGAPNAVEGGWTRVVDQAFATPDNRRLVVDVRTATADGAQSLPTHFSTNSNGRWYSAAVAIRKAS